MYTVVEENNEIVIYLNIIKYCVRIEKYKNSWFESAYIENKMLQYQGIHLVHILFLHVSNIVNIDIVKIDCNR